MVRFRDATKSYPDGTVALRSVNLEVPRGQFCVVLGASGAGKSTLLRAVNGLVTLTSGSLEVEGMPVRPDTLGAVRSRVGMVHQQFGLVGRATVLENVLGGALRRVSTTRALFNLFPEVYRRKACSLLDDLGLTEEHLYRRASELSGGQQQRVALARAFLLDPAVVVADEPVASLDVAMSHTILRLLREMSARRGTTVLCSLHQVDLARQFADRIVAMRGGRVISDGPPSELDDAASVRIYSRAPSALAGPPETPPSGQAPAAPLAAQAPARDGGPESLPPRGAEADAARLSTEGGPALSGEPPPPRPSAAWALRQPFGKGAIAAALLAFVLLGFSAQQTEIPRLFSYLGDWVAASFGARHESQIGKGLGHFAKGSFPLVIERVTPVTRVEGFDRRHLPLFARVETRETRTARYDFDRKAMGEVVEREEVLVEPVGYLLEVCGKVLVSLQIALWGTLFALVLGLPLACIGARGYAPHRAVYLASRTGSSFLRAVPELVSALILTLAFGFGPMAAVVAMALHSAGFFGKFFADDIENAERGPQEALLAVGANRLKVLRFAVLPQVLPQYVAYGQYILERNVRMSTVIGVVGAGGIGVELKGRFDMYEYDHVSTILLVVFITVLLLEQLSQRLRARLIRVG